MAEEGYRAVAVDRRGHGHSEAGDVEWIPVHLHADDLRLTLELRDIQHAHLAGVSYGALVCLEFALSWPDRVLSLTLIEPPIFTWAQDEPDYKPWFDRFIEINRIASEGMPIEDWLPAWLSLIDSSMAAEITSSSSFWPLVERQGPLIHKEEAGWEYRPDDEALSMLTHPTLVLNGDESEPPMQFIGEMLAKKMPLSSHQWVKGGHDFHAKNADDFNFLLLQFLKANS